MKSYSFPMWISGECILLSDVVNLMKGTTAVHWYVGDVEFIGGVPTYLVDSTDDEPIYLSWRLLTEVSRELPQVLDGRFLGSLHPLDLPHVSAILGHEYLDISGVYIEAFDSGSWRIIFTEDALDDGAFRAELAKLLLRDTTGSSGLSGS
ncbi:MAG: hypothetical protein WAV90_15615 [Gordonia amarae]